MTVNESPAANDCSRVGAISLIGVPFISLRSRLCDVSIQLLTDSSAIRIIYLLIAKSATLKLDTKVWVYLLLSFKVSNWRHIFFLLIFQKKKTLQATHQAQKRLRANGMEAYTIERDARARSLLPPPPQQPVPAQPLPSPPRTLRLPGTEHADYAVRAPDIDTDHLPPPPPPPASASPGTVRMRATPGGRVVYSARSDQLLRSPLVANKYDVSVWKSECWKNKPAKSFRSIRYSYFKKQQKRKYIYYKYIF